ncbi:tautomerase family protein [Actinotalea sp. BY-33]|uniref:Tautomerase family protein n=1 Tax=Actinotalea soli TaxID=2819234 RepID=A0A939LPE6_9CELL|nr:tautomerase family protein [Actinotalea soli]MBO1751438.1 tautomerase family protein [Actinotalea soli]
MTQVKIFGQRDVLAPLRAEMSDVVHAAAVEVLGLPESKRFHRFFPMAPEDFPVPEGRTERYTILEVLMFEGRLALTKKAFYARLYADFEAQLGIGAVDLEVTIMETPRHDWAIRGTAGDELELNYEVEQ